MALAVNSQGGVHRLPTIPHLIAIAKATSKRPLTVSKKLSIALPSLKIGFAGGDIKCRIFSTVKSMGLKQ